MKDSQPYGLRHSIIMPLTVVDLHSSRECWLAARGEGGAGGEKREGERGKGAREGEIH